MERDFLGLNSKNDAMASREDFSDSSKNSGMFMSRLLHHRLVHLFRFPWKFCVISWKSVWRI